MATVNRTIGGFSLSTFNALPAGAFFERFGALCIKLHNGLYRSFNPNSLVEVTDGTFEVVVIQDTAVAINYLT